MKDQFWLMFTVIFLIIISVDSDCLTPGKASGAEFFPQLTERYPQMSKISYRCKLGSRLFSSSENRRICKNGTWIGEIPRCGIGPHIDRQIMHYEIYNGTNKVMQNSHKCQTYVEVSERRVLENSLDLSLCSEVYRNLNSNQTWIFKIVNDYESVRYIELSFVGWPVFTDHSVRNTPKLALWLDTQTHREFKLISFKQYNQSSPHTLTILQFAHSNTYLADEERYCTTKLIPPVSWWDWHDIRLILNGNHFAGDVRFCALDVYKLPNDCGTFDTPVNAKIKSREHFSNRECVEFECDKSYRLIGDKDIECGEYAKWIGSVPVCVPNITCPRDNITDDPQLQVKYENTYNGNTIAKHSVAVYSCKDSSLLLGNSQRTCTENGTWDHNRPKCVSNSNQQTSSSLKFIVIALTILLICTVTDFVIGLKMYINKHKPSDEPSVHFKTKINDYDDCNVINDYETIEDYDENYYQIVSNQNTYNEYHHYISPQDCEDPTYITIQ